MELEGGGVGKSGELLILAQTLMGAASQIFHFDQRF